MKPSSPDLFLKIVVLSVFVLLMGGFVAYRSGVFEKTYPTGTAKQSNAPDSTGIPSGRHSKTVSIQAFYMDETLSSSKNAYPVYEPPVRKKKSKIDITKEPTMMSGSKSIRVTNKSLFESITDTHKPKPLYRPEDSTEWKKQMIIMSSSKSGGIYLPEGSDTLFRKGRTLPEPKRVDFSDSLQQKKIRMMYSSKSGYIYEPEDFKPEKKDTLKKNDK